MRRQRSKWKKERKIDGILKMNEKNSLQPFIFLSFTFLIPLAFEISILVQKFIFHIFQSLIWERRELRDSGGKEKIIG